MASSLIKSRARSALSPRAVSPDAKEATSFYNPKHIGDGAQMAYMDSFEQEDEEEDAEEECGIPDVEPPTHVEHLRQAIEGVGMLNNIFNGAIIMRDHAVVQSVTGMVEQWMMDEGVEAQTVRDFHVFADSIDSMLYEIEEERDNG